MKTVCMYLPLLVMSLTASGALGGDLTVDIRTYPGDEVVVGGEGLLWCDPLFIEVTVSNHSDTLIEGLEPVFGYGTIRVEIYDSDRNVIQRIGEGIGGLVGSVNKVQFRPNQLRRLFFYIFVPRVHQTDHPLWSAHRGRTLLGVVYQKAKDARSGSFTEVRSRWHSLSVFPRDRIEQLALEAAAVAKTTTAERGPSIHDFDIQTNYPQGRAELFSLAATVRSGQLPDLLFAAIRLQNIYRLPPEEREAPSRELAKWISGLPDIKRQALGRRIQSVASSYLPLLDTAEIIGEVLKSEEDTKSNNP